MDFLRHFITEEIYIVPDKRIEKPVAATMEQTQKEEALPEPLSPPHSEDFKVSVATSSLGPAEEKLLSAILSAIKIEDADVQRCEDFSSCLSDKVILFGNLKDKPSVDFYSITKVNSKAVLLSDGLSQINADVEKKKKLWSALKEMFSV